MKKSELKLFIKENIIDILSEDLDDKEEQVDRISQKVDNLTDKISNIKFEEDASDAIDYDTYVEIGKGYLAGFKRPHSLNDDELETLGRKVVSSLYKGNIDRAEDELVVTEDEDIDDKDAIKAAKAAKGKNKRYDLALQQLKKVEKNMASLGKNYSKASGVEKENILKQLKDLTNQKNELKALVDKYADDLV